MFNSDIIVDTTPGLLTHHHLWIKSARAHLTIDNWMEKAINFKTHPLKQQIQDVICLPWYD